MKLFVKRYLTSYFFASLVLMGLAIIEVWRFGEMNGYIRVLLFNALVAFFITLSITFFLLKLRHDWLNVVLGILPLLPIPILLTILFGHTIFRTSAVMLLIFVIGIIGYSVSAYGLHRKAIRESIEMNRLLERSSPKDHQPK